MVYHTKMSTTNIHFVGFFSRWTNNSVVLFQFVADYHGEDRFLTRIGVGGLINMEKIDQAHTVLNDIHLFQQRPLAPENNSCDNSPTGSLTSLRNSQEFISVR